ncbi:MAG TPA: histidinol-phosphate transaminase [Vicinamibacteria bacterium]|nr:histidinol-phosphate transaminase [Vicinamibacteria bacterium]
MTSPSVSRRRFALSLGATLGAAVTRPSGAATREGATRTAIVDLSSNENPYGPSPAALEAMTRSQAVACRYPDEAERATAEAIARMHGVSPERVVLGAGSSEVLRLCDAAFLGPGRTVVVAEPTFEAVLHYAKVTTAEPVAVPLTADFRHDLPAMARSCDARTGLVYVCNPNNPTGTIVTGDELAAFLERVPATATVVVDEAYHHFAEAPAHRSALEIVDRFPNLVVARTFSKIYGMAGMRLGYGVTSAANAEALRAHASWSNVNAAVLAAARASLADEGLVARLREKLNGTRRWLVAELERDGRRTIPSETNFVMIDTGGDVEPLIEGLFSRGIRVGRRFAALPTWLRITIGTPEEMQAFLKAFREAAPARPAAA